MADRLTTKQELFISAYLGEASGNATEAARRAGYKHAEASAKDNLRNPTVIARVKEHVAKYTATSDDILAELLEIASAPWTEFVEVLSRDKKTGRPLKVKMDLTNKVKALELLGKYHQLFVEKAELDVNIREHRVIGIQQDALEAMFRPADAPELNA